MNKAHANLKRSVAFAALAIGCSSGAWAQDTAANEGLEEIVVTARRVTENLQDVPISVGTVDSKALVARGITSLTELKTAVANVTITKTGVAGGNYVFIRGISGATIPNVAVDSSIGLYVDGVYLGRQNSSGGEIADLERVEVLRGPQGTLAGRNAAGGAVNFITASPTGEFGVIADATVGNFARYRGRLTLNTPEFGGFSGRFTYIHDQNHGTIRNIAGGRVFNYGGGFGSYKAANRVDSLNAEAVMAKIRYNGTDNLLVDYKFDYNEQKEVFPGSPTVGFPTSAVGAGAANLFLTQPAGSIPLFQRRPEYVNLALLAPAPIKTYGHTLTATLDLSDDVTVKSITGYRDLKTRQQGPVDGLTLNFPFCVSCSVVEVEQHQFSQELQLLGKLDALKYIFGLYYFREKGSDNLAFSFFKSLAPVNGVIPITNSDYASAGSKDDVTNTSYAIYGHLDYDIFDSLALAVGGRYSVDKRVSIDGRPSTVGGPIRYDIKYKRFNYDVALTYSVTDDIHIYGRYATGYKSGGITRGANFRPEDHKGYEVGFKTELFDRKVRFNADYFDTKVDDLQRVSVNAGGLIVENFASSKINGVEAELLVVPVRGLTLGANYGYHKLKTISQDVPFPPRTTMTYSAQYDSREFSNGSYLSFRVDADYRSKYYGAGFLTEAQRTADPRFPIPAAIVAPFGGQQAYQDAIIRNNLGGDYWLANVRIGINDVPIGGSTARFAVYARNLLDTEGRNYTVNNSLYQTSYERPLTYGFEVGFSF